MIITVGSKNKVKIAAVEEAISMYPKIFSSPEVTELDVGVKLYGHPKNIKETVGGAVDRAKRAFIDCDYSFGIEGGLMEVPLAKTGFMEVGVCAIYDSKNFYLGLSPAFEWPKEVTDLILRGEADASQAFKQLRLTNHEKLGAEKGGIIGYLTEGRLTREAYIKYSIIMALIRLEKKELYS